MDVGSQRRCTRCGCLLSRYNADQQCASCERVDLMTVPEVPVVPDRVWQDPEVRAALADWDFGLASRLVRRRGSLRQDDIAAMTGLSQAFLSMLESGSRKLTNIDRVVQFLNGIGAPGDLVRLPLTAGQTRPRRAVDPVGDDRDPALPWTAARMVAALNDAVGGDTVNRRKFLTVSGIALTAYVHHWGTAEAEPLFRAQNGSQVSEELLGHLQGTIDHLRVMDASAGSGTLAELGNAHLALILRVLKRGTYSEATGRRLAAIAADTATQAGWFSFDAGQHDAAQTYLLAALRAAHASGDARLGAGALSYIAIHGYSTGHPRDAVVAAQAAREKAKALDAPALQAMLLTRQARGHAKLGERQAVLRALGQAAELCARGQSENDPHWLYWINEGEIHGQAGSCHLDLGEPAEAVDSLIKATQAVNTTSHRTQAQFLSRAAIAEIKRGELEAACDIGHQAAALAEELQSARLNEHLQSLTTELAPVAHYPQASDLIERVGAITAPRTENIT